MYVGSTGAIPELPIGEQIREVEQYDPDKVIGWYSKTKAMASQKVLDAIRNNDIDACIVHPAGIMGPNDYSNSTTHTVLQILRGEMPIGMKGSFNLSDVRDLAEGCILAAEKGKKGQSYILGNEEITLKELCTLLRKDSYCKPIRFYMPLWLASFIAKMAEKKAKNTGKQPLMTSFSVYNLARNNAFDSNKAKSELGYRTRSYSETVHDQVNWLVSSGQYTIA